MRMYWDTCVVVYVVEGVQPLQQLVRDRLLQTEGTIGIYVSELVRLECRVQPLRDGDDGMLALFDRFFANTEVTTVDLPRQAWSLATDLRARHRLRTPDALHLACAHVHGCTALWTNEDRLAKAAHGLARNILK